MFAELGIYGARRAKSIPRYKPFVAMSSFTLWRWHTFFSALFSSPIRTQSWQPPRSRSLRSRFQNSLSLKPNFFSGSTQTMTMSWVVRRPTSKARPGNTSARWWEVGVAPILFFPPPLCPYFDFEICRKKTACKTNSKDLRKAALSKSSDSYSELLKVF